MRYLTGWSVAVQLAILLTVAVGCPLVIVVPGEGEGWSQPFQPSVPDIEMVWIEPGTFEMGRYSGEQGSSATEDPQHTVTLYSGFWLGKYEVTKGQWETLMGTTPWRNADYVLDDPDSPAIDMFPRDAREFIELLNRLSGQTFRLPSEAEWEYACRAGTTTRFYWGDDPDYTAIDDYAWWEYNASDLLQRYAHVVGLKLPNAWGLYDMSGNVYEWCADNWHDSYDGAPSDGSAWVNSPRNAPQVCRGGSWIGGAWYCRSARRRNGTVSIIGSNPYNFYGFRLAR